MSLLSNITTSSNNSDVKRKDLHLLNYSNLKPANDKHKMGNIVIPNQWNKHCFSMENLFYLEITAQKLPSL